MASKKLCKKCGKTKPTDQFPIRRRYGKEAPTSPCKSCVSTKQQEWRTNNPNIGRAAARLRKYRITDDEYQRLLDAQDHRCSICEQPETQMIRGKVLPLSVDHDHETGKVRGLLCSTCNATLGFVKDDPNHLFAAIQYLDETGVSTRRGIPTTQEIFGAIQAVSARIDDTNQRIDDTFGGQRGLSEQMTKLHTCMVKLEQTTNSRLHEMEADITTIKRPWLLLASGWTKALAVGGFAAAISGTIVRLELWRFLPF